MYDLLCRALPLTITPSALADGGHSRGGGICYSDIPSPNTIPYSAYCKLVTSAAARHAVRNPAAAPAPPPAGGFSTRRLQIRGYQGHPVTVVHAYRYFRSQRSSRASASHVIVPPDMRRPCNCYLWALNRPGGLVLTSRADQLHRMPLICAVTADQHVLNMAK
jgi:hypothetical protein